MNSKRTIFLDITKGIGILLVVLVHCNYAGEEFLHSTVISSFFMPLFFIVSGYLLRLKEGNINKKTVAKHIKKYLVYYLVVVVLNLSFYYVKRILQGAFFGNLNKIVKHTILVFLGIESEGGSWFVITLSVGYGLLSVILIFLDENKAMMFHMCLFIIYLVIYLNGINNVIEKMLTRLFLCELYIYIGYVIKNIVEMIKGNKILCFCAFILFSIIVFIFAMKNGQVNLAEMEINNAYTYMLCGILGTVSTMTFAVLVSPIKFISTLIAFIGRNTIWILATNQIIISIVRTLVNSIIFYDILRVTITFIIVAIVEIILIKVINMKKVSRIYENCSD